MNDLLIVILKKESQIKLTNAHNKLTKNAN